MKTKTLIVVNPISGIGRQKRIETLLKQNLNEDLFDYQVKYTEHIHHGTEIAREAADKGFDCVVACGGDGSVNDVAIKSPRSKKTLSAVLKKIFALATALSSPSKIILSCVIIFSFILTPRKLIRAKLISK